LMLLRERGAGMELTIRQAAEYRQK
jgi:hypothetical protein